MAHVFRTGHASTRLLVVGILVVAVGAAAWALRPTPVATLPIAPPVVSEPKPLPPPILEIPVQAPPVPETPATIEPEPAPVAEPVASIPLQDITLSDGRRFIGVRDEAGHSIIVQAAVRGGSMTRMQSIIIRAGDDEIAKLMPYDGRYGDLAVAFVAPPVDPARAAEVARNRAAAAARAEERRAAAAERERIRLEEQRRTEAALRVSTAQAALDSAIDRERLLTARVPLLTDDRRAKQELINGLQLQMNAAQDRWNLELQTLGPRVKKADGTWAGGPTPATEELVANLDRQLIQARRTLTGLEQTMRSEAEERQTLAVTRPRLEAEVTAATAAVASLQP